MATLPTKDPADTVDYVLDWSSLLAIYEDTIASTEVEVESGLTLVDTDNTTTTVTFWVSGGEDGRTYSVDCTIVTAGARTIQRSFSLPVKELSAEAAPLVGGRAYCTVYEMLADIERAGVKAWKEAQAFAFIRSVSQWIDERLGNFIPTTETRYFDGTGKPDLLVEPLLSVTTLTLDATDIASTQYIMYPRRRYWENGPYTRLSVDPDATNLSVWTREKDVVAIAGRWGLYEKAVDLSATVASQTAAATSLVVDRADEISPGAVLLIGSEQELVTATGAPTDSTANLAEDLDASEEEIDLSDASLVYTGETIRVNFEQMLVLDKSGNTVLVFRGYNGTKRTTHTTAADVYVYRTFTVERGVNGTTAVAHTEASIDRYVAPPDVAYLCRQIAALMLKKAEGGYAGKVGNVELGEVFYNAEFPADALKQIERNYRIVRL